MQTSKKNSSPKIEHVDTENPKQEHVDTENPKQDDTDKF